MVLTIEVNIHQYDEDEDNEIFSFEIIFKKSGITIHTLISEPYLIPIEKFRNFIDSIETHVPGEVHLNFYQGNGDGHFNVEDRIFTIRTAPSGAGGDLSTDVEFDLEKYGGVIASAFREILSNEIVTKSKWANKSG